MPREFEDGAQRALLRMVMLPARFAVQAAHLTVPATRWQMVEGAIRKSDADLVMLDLEDSIPRDDATALELGRANVVRALSELDWGRKLRFFRPRGVDLDPRLDDLRFVLPRAREKLEGIVVPKVLGPDDVMRFDHTLAEIERAEGLEVGRVKMQVLIESVTAEEQAFEVARATSRLVGLVFGAFDYWSSLRMALVDYRFDHPAVDAARLRIVKAAASVGVPAIAEMTTDYPTKEKTPAERESALATCVRHAEHARDLGMASSAVYRYFPSRDELLTAAATVRSDPAVLCVVKQKPRASLLRAVPAASRRSRHPLKRSRIGSSCWACAFERTGIVLVPAALRSGLRRRTSAKVGAAITALPCVSFTEVVTYAA